MGGGLICKQNSVAKQCNTQHKPQDERDSGTRDPTTASHQIKQIPHEV